MSGTNTANCAYPKCNKSAKKYYGGEIAICAEHQELSEFIVIMLSAVIRYDSKEYQSEMR